LPVLGAAPVRFPFEETFVVDNPCTGESMTVTNTGTFTVIERGRGVSHLLDHNVTTSDGFVGHGHEVSINHDQIFLVREVLRNDEGQIIHGEITLVMDATGTVRVLDFGLTCV
jgi:hypothetical protein